MEKWPGNETFNAEQTYLTREGTPTDKTCDDVSSLHTGANALLKAMRQCWSIENSWHWVRDVHLREDAYCNRELNGVHILATVRSLAISALRLDGILSISRGHGRIG